MIIQSLAVLSVSLAVGVLGCKLSYKRDGTELEKEWSVMTCTPWKQDSCRKVLLTTVEGEEALKGGQR